MKRHLSITIVGAVVLCSTAACTRESTRIALESQRRADATQQAVFDHQHQALRILLYRDLVHRLEAGHAPLTAAQRSAINEAWNERDLLEFWNVQQERARALRLVGVDVKLWADQSIVDLLIKQLDRRAARVTPVAATYLGKPLTSAAATPTKDPPATEGDAHDPDE